MSLGVTGRIYLNEDGANVQMACHPRSTLAAMNAVKTVSNGVFSNIRLFKNEIVDTSKHEPLFPGLHVRVRPQLNDGLPAPLSRGLDKHMDGIKHLTPAEWHAQLAEQQSRGAEAAKVLDMRNTYEYELGSFTGAVPVDVAAYSDTLPEVDRLLGSPGEPGYSLRRKLKVMHANMSTSEPLVPAPAKPVEKTDPVFMYCTGGIRCLKVGAYLNKQGYTDVRTLAGGINAYVQYALSELPDRSESLFQGVNVVFDGRRGLRVTEDTVSDCHHCGQPCAVQVNCEHHACDILFIQCEGCAEIYRGCCSVLCTDAQAGYGDVVRENIRSHNARADALRDADEAGSEHKCGPGCSHDAQQMEGADAHARAHVRLVPAPPAPGHMRPRIAPLKYHAPQ
jgi:UPF0176 protein